METISAASSFSSEAKSHASTVPHTPPYTPHRPKRALERSDSPASIRSVHPAETSSPAKKAAKRRNVVETDDVKVEELREGDAGYLTDADVVYPGELEEVRSEAGGEGDGEDEDETARVAEKGVILESDTGIEQRFELLGCHDETRDEEVEFEKKRREKHRRHRTNSRVFKRSHSQSIKGGEGAPVDVDAMADHDLIGSARRLRRRVERGPEVERGSLSPLARRRDVAERRAQGKGREFDDDDEHDEKTDNSSDEDAENNAMDM